jgi:hypothetical protein
MQRISMSGKKFDVFAINLVVDGATLGRGLMQFKELLYGSLPFLLRHVIKTLNHIFNWF